MQRSETTPDEFLASLPDDVRDDMVAVDEGSGSRVHR